MSKYTTYLLIEHFLLDIEYSYGRTSLFLIKCYLLSIPKMLQLHDFPLRQVSPFSSRQVLFG